MLGGRGQAHYPVKHEVEDERHDDEVGNFNGVPAKKVGEDAVEPRILLLQEDKSFSGEHKCHWAQREHEGGHGKEVQEAHQRVPPYNALVVFVAQPEVQSSRVEAHN